MNPLDLNRGDLVWLKYDHERKELVMALRVNMQAWEVCEFEEGKPFAQLEVRFSRNHINVCFLQRDDAVAKVLSRGEVIVVPLTLLQPQSMTRSAAQ